MKIGIYQVKRRGALSGYESMVVLANSEEEAIELHPYVGKFARLVSGTWEYTGPVLGLSAAGKMDQFKAFIQSCWATDKGALEVSNIGFAEDSAGEWIGTVNRLLWKYPEQVISRETVSQWQLPCQAAENGQEKTA